MPAAPIEAGADELQVLWQYLRRAMVHMMTTEPESWTKQLTFTKLREHVCSELGRDYPGKRWRKWFRDATRLLLVSATEHGAEATAQLETPLELLVMRPKRPKSKRVKAPADKAPADSGADQPPKPRAVAWGDDVVGGEDDGAGGRPSGERGGGGARAAASARMAKVKATRAAAARAAEGERRGRHGGDEAGGGTAEGATREGSEGAEAAKKPPQQRRKLVAAEVFPLHARWHGTAPNARCCPDRIAAEAAAAKAAARAARAKRAGRAPPRSTKPLRTRAEAAKAAEEAKEAEAVALRQSLACGGRPPLPYHPLPSPLSLPPPLPRRSVVQDDLPFARVTPRSLTKCLASLPVCAAHDWQADMRKELVRGAKRRHTKATRKAGKAVRYVAPKQHAERARLRPEATPRSPRTAPRAPPCLPRTMRCGDETAFWWWARDSYRATRSLDSDSQIGFPKRKSHASRNATHCEADPDRAVPTPAVTRAPSLHAAAWSSTSSRRRDPS